MKLKQIAVAVFEAFHPYVMRHVVRIGAVLPAIALEVDALEAVPEGQRAWYAQDATTKKFKLDPAKVEIEDVSGLKAALAAERTAVVNAKAKAKTDMEALALKYKDIDPDKYREIMSQFDSEEEAALLKKGAEGIKVIIDKRTEKLRKEFEKKLEDAAKERDGAMEVASTFMDRTLDNHIRAAASAAGLHPGAVEDALLRASRVFSLNDEGEAVQFEEDGETIVLGKDGKTPFSPAEWLEGMKESAPHWFPAGASGGGAGGNRARSGGGQKTMKRAAFEALAPQQKSDFTIKEKGVVVD